MVKGERFIYRPREVKMEGQDEKLRKVWDARREKNMDCTFSNP